MNLTDRILFLTIILLLTSNSIKAQDHSVARAWVEVNLDAIRMDFARPPQTARSLHQLSIAMYDAWAVYDSVAEPYFVGHSLGDFSCPFFGVEAPPADSIKYYQEQAIHFAAARFIEGRYDYYNPILVVPDLLDSMAVAYDLDLTFNSVDYSTGDPRALGNFIAQELLAAGLVDGSNEGTGDINGYQNQFYEPVNDSLDIQFPEYVGNHTIDSLNRWQPISFLLFCDQTMNNFVNIVPDFIGAEWGEVVPFALRDTDMEIKEREGHEWKVYMDPGPMPRIDTLSSTESQLHQWNMQLVAKWSGHLDPADTTLWDISPASIGNIDIEDFPDDFAEYDQYYDFDNGGFASPGHPINPITGDLYEPQIVKRGDYARIIAEYWADGPDSETPPGHWFAIYNETSDHPMFERRWKGEGPLLDTLEFDLKSYMTLGAALHDAAVACWSVKGYYDFIRPVSSIRAMAELGQISDPNLPNYDSTGRGLPLVPGFIELIEAGDPLAGENDMYLNELKLMCWDGPNDADTCIAGLAPAYDIAVAGVKWKLALDWWPYQRPNFISPAFAGYVSGHSVFSRAAAEVMTLITGDRFFPGGIAEFECPQNQFLVFEEGPSETITLQWATYQDAADQSGLSRIWGGIHPPTDDIPGRKIGYEVGHLSFRKADSLMNGGVPNLVEIAFSQSLITDADDGNTISLNLGYDRPMSPDYLPEVSLSPLLSSSLSLASGPIWTDPYTAVLTYTVSDSDVRIEASEIDIAGGRSANNVEQVDYSGNTGLFVDTENPSIENVTVSTSLIDGSLIGNETFEIQVLFNEQMDESGTPTMTFPVEDPSNAITLNTTSFWSDIDEYTFTYDVEDNLIILDDVDLLVSLYSDSVGNPGEPMSFADQFDISMVTSLDELHNSDISIIPNPSSSNQALTIHTGNMEWSTVRVFDLSSKLLYDQINTTGTSPEFTIPSELIPNGYYLLEISNSDGVFSLPIIRY